MACAQRISTRSTRKCWHLSTSGNYKSMIKQYWKDPTAENRGPPEPLKMPCPRRPWSPFACHSPCGRNRKASRRRARFQVEIPRKRICKAALDAASPASGAGQTRCRQTRLSAVRGSILARSYREFFGPDPQAVKTIVQRESRHWMHSMNGRSPFRP